MVVSEFMRVKSVKLDSVVTSVATPNIAFTKYWGRRDESLNLPHNSTISMTLNETLRTTTSVAFSRSLSRDALYINGEEQDPFTNEEIPTYIRKVLNIMRDMAGIDAKALVVSENSFPADVGLASSASGAAALTH